MTTREEDLIFEVERLKAGIREHRDQKGDDRCFLDDQQLYSLLGEGPAVTVLPALANFLSNCARYHASRQVPGEKYETEADRHRVLKERVAALEAELYAFQVELWDLLPELHHWANPPNTLNTKDVKAAFGLWREDRERLCAAILKQERAGPGGTCLWCHQVANHLDCSMFSYNGMVALREI